MEKDFSPPGIMRRWARDPDFINYSWSLKEPRHREPQLGSRDKKGERPHSVAAPPSLG